MTLKCNVLVCEGCSQLWLLTVKVPYYSCDLEGVGVATTENWNKRDLPPDCVRYMEHVVLWQEMAHGAKEKV